MSPDQLNDMRKRVLNGEPYSKAEFAEAIRAMVSQRIQEAAPATKTKSTSVKKSVTSLDDLL